MSNEILENEETVIDETVGESNNTELENEVEIDETEGSNTDINEEGTVSEQPEPSIEFEEAHTMAMHSYVKLSDKYSDVLSSATTMLLVGGAGMILLICLIAGIFPINLGQTAWLFYSVMGIVFVAFIIAGFISYKNATELKSAALEEDKLIQEMSVWAEENIEISEIDTDLDLNDSIEELFFSRFATIKNKLMHQFETADEPLIDEISEQIYQKLYESEEFDSSSEDENIALETEETSTED